MTTFDPHTGVTNPVPRPASIGVGLLTKTGLGTTLLMFVSAVVDLIAGDTFDADTRALLAAGVATAVATILARGYQAGQLIAAKHNITLPDQPLR
jgi:hypothetical protein